MKKSFNTHYSLTKFSILLLLMKMIVSVTYLISGIYTQCWFSGLAISNAEI